MTKFLGNTKSNLSHGGQTVKDNAFGERKVTKPVKDKKKEFEDSFGAFHKDAPAYLRDEAKKLKKQ